MWGYFWLCAQDFNRLSLKRKGKSFDIFKLLFSVFYITSLLWLPLLSCYGHQHHCHAVAALCPNTVSVLCLTVHGNRFSQGDRGVVEKYVVCSKGISCNVYFSYHGYNNNTQQDMVNVLLEATVDGFIKEKNDCSLLQLSH